MLHPPAPRGLCTGVRRRNGWYVGAEFLPFYVPKQWPHVSDFASHYPLCGKKFGRRKMLRQLVHVGLGVFLDALSVSLLFGLVGVGSFM